MDVLEKYKDAWGKQPDDENKVNSLEIYKMIHAKSSSIVKWIFIIGIIEFVFWIVINLMTPESFYKIYEDLNLEQFLTLFTVAHYGIVLVFLYYFYTNYTKISLVDNTKRLINNILRIRKTVQYYVYYNLASVFLISLVVNITMFSDTDQMQKIVNPDNLAMDISKIVTVTVISQLIALALILLFLWLFYKLIYGILLKKLNRNYKELIRLEKLD